MEILLNALGMVGVGLTYGAYSDLKSAKAVSAAQIVNDIEKVEFKGEVPTCNNTLICGSYNPSNQKITVNGKEVSLINKKWYNSSIPTTDNFYGDLYKGKINGETITYLKQRSYVDKSNTSPEICQHFAKSSIPKLRRLPFIFGAGSLALFAGAQYWSNPYGFMRKVDDLKNTITGNTSNKKKEIMIKFD
jgi:hypothetical protein